MALSRHRYILHKMSTNLTDSTWVYRGSVLLKTELKVYTCLYKRSLSYRFNPPKPVRKLTVSNVYQRSF